MITHDAAALEGLYDTAPAVEYARAMGASQRECDHMHACLSALVKYGRGEISRGCLGGFTGSLVDGDFIQACGQADQINRKYLPAYAMFLHNEMPSSKIRLLCRSDAKTVKEPTP